MLKFLRFLNPFYTAAKIVALETDLALAKQSRGFWLDTARVLRDIVNEKAADLATHEQAIDAFMGERADLKAQIDILEDAGLAVTEMFVRAGQEAASYAQALLEGGAELQSIAQHLKAAEDRLAAAGIKLTMGDNGPIVVVNQETFLAAVRAADHANGPDITLAA